MVGGIYYLLLEIKREFVTSEVEEMSGHSWFAASEALYEVLWERSVSSRDS